MSIGTFNFQSGGDRSPDSYDSYLKTFAFNLNRLILDKPNVALIKLVRLVHPIGGYQPGSDRFILQLLAES